MFSGRPERRTMIQDGEWGDLNKKWRKRKNKVPMKMIRTRGWVFFVGENPNLMEQTK